MGCVSRCNGDTNCMRSCGQATAPIRRDLGVPADLTSHADCIKGCNRNPMCEAGCKKVVDVKDTMKANGLADRRNLAAPKGPLNMLRRKGGHKGGNLRDSGKKALCLLGCGDDKKCQANCGKGDPLEKCKKQCKGSKPQCMVACEQRQKQECVNKCKTPKCKKKCGGKKKRPATGDKPDVVNTQKV